MGPEDVLDPHSVVNSPRVSLLEGEELHMLVFRLEEMVLIMFVDSSVVADFHFFRELSSTLLAVLPVVAKSLSDKLVRQSVG